LESLLLVWRIEHLGDLSVLGVQTRVQNLKQSRGVLLLQLQGLHELHEDVVAKMIILVLGVALITEIKVLTVCALE
jgi:hypothetical protein